VRIGGTTEAAVTPAGTLIHQAMTTESQVGWVSMRGEFTPVLREPRAYAWPRLSPDGRRLALSIRSGQRADIWSYDLASTPTCLTTDVTVNDRPEWTPEGRRVLYRSDRGARTAGGSRWT
jgi:Tol biopolymer transport system component